MAMAGGGEPLFHVEVEYITTVTAETGTVVHIFNDVMHTRLLLLLDDPTGKVDYETAIQRCVEVSKVECITVPAQVVQELQHAPRGKYDALLDRFAMVDFVRMVGGVFRARESSLPVVEMLEGQMIGKQVACRRSGVPIMPAQSPGFGGGGYGGGPAQPVYAHSPAPVGYDNGYGGSPVARAPSGGYGRTPSPLRQQYPRPGTDIIKFQTTLPQGSRTTGGRPM